MPRKRLLSIFLITILLFLSCPQYSFAASATRIISADTGFSADVGTITDQPQTDPNKPGSLNSRSAGILQQLQGNGSGYTPVSFGGTIPQLDSNRVAVSLYGKNAAAGDTPVLTDASGNLLVSLATTLSSSSDSIDVDFMSKGAVTTVHSAIQYDSNGLEIDCRGHKKLSVECNISNISSGNWIISVIGSATSGAAFGNCYTLLSTGWESMQTPPLDTNGKYTFYFDGIPNYVKIYADCNTVDGTLTCKVTPMN